MRFLVVAALLVLGQADRALEVTDLSASSDGFDWGGQCGGSGSGSFEQSIEQGAQVEVGMIPAGKQKVRISLQSPEDVDLRLYEAAEPRGNLVGWPNGNLNGPGVQSMVYRGSSIKWSGYNGVGGQLGYEYIEIDGEPLAADLVLFAFGYRAGTAKVDYSYSTAPCKKSFTVYVGNKDIVRLGSIPAGLLDVSIELSATQDLDIQLQEESGDRILLVGWPNGVMNQAGAQEKSIPISNGKSQMVSYSGYNGDGGKGNEWIELRGETSTNYDMRVFGYAAGECTVTYSWSVSDAPAPPVSDDNAKILQVDMLPEVNRQDKARNVFLYRDDDIAQGKLLIRRGSYAQLKLTLNTPLQDGYSLQGSLKAVGYSHTQPLPATPDCSSSQWGLCVSGQDESAGQAVIHLKLLVPTSAPFAEWTLSLMLVKNGLVVSTHVESARKVFILFNPYHAGDAVYIQGEQARAEYIENENGAIWVGGQHSNAPRQWAYNQYNIKALIAAYQVLSRPNQNGFVMPISSLADPAKVARALSYKVAADMLIGRWHEPYCQQDPCENTKPWVWGGSMPIIEQYLADFKPAKWGQCWVFAGTLCTLARAIGIPTRTVTNFQSAHDVRPYDSMVTKHWTYAPVVEGGRIVKYVWQHNGEYDRDSVWNFHVWNEMWMTRPDLESASCGSTSFDGWQVVDATWQEQSSFESLMAPNDNYRYYQCGPLPVAAVRHQCKDIKYDYLFIYGEVDSDQEEVVRNLKEYPNLSLVNPKSSDWKRDVWGYTVSTTAIGKLISTSALGGDIYQRNVVTSNYKTPEEAQQTRLGEARVEEHQCLVDGWGTVHVDRPVALQAGTDYEARVLLQRTDNSSDAGDLDASFDLSILHYTGEFAAKLLQTIESISMDQSGQGELLVRLPSMDYAEQLRHGVTISLTVSVQQGDQLIARVTDVRTLVKLPAIEMAMSTGEILQRCESDDTSDESMGFELQVTNPFKMLGVSASTVVVEVGGMDKTPEFGNPEWQFSIPALDPGSNHSITKQYVSTKALGCGLHIVSATWDINEFAETQDAIGSTEFIIDCSRCSTNTNPHDETKDARVQLSDMPTPSTQAQNGDDDNEEEPTARTDASWDLIAKVNVTLNVQHPSASKAAKQARGP